MATARLPLVALALLAAVGCGKAELREYVSEEGRFKVLLYPNPREGERLVGSDTAYGAISVGYRDVDVADGPGAEQLLVEARDQLLSNLPATLVEADRKGPRNKLVLAGKHPGLEVRAQLGTDRDKNQDFGEYRARLYLVGRRLYFVQAVGFESFVWSDDANRFLESFEVIP